MSDSRNWLTLACTRAKKELLAVVVRWVACEASVKTNWRQYVCEWLHACQHRVAAAHEHVWICNRVCVLWECVYVCICLWERALACVECCVIIIRRAGLKRARTNKHARTSSRTPNSTRLVRASTGSDSRLRPPRHKFHLLAFTAVDADVVVANFVSGACAFASHMHSLSHTHTRARSPLAHAHKYANAHTHALTIWRRARACGI